MKKRGATLFLALLLIFSGLIVFTSFSGAQDGGAPKISKHAKRDIQCQDCHDNDTSKRVAMPRCLQCHGSYEKVAERTRKDQPNPHESHLGQVRCGECHREHGQSVNSCKECHTFEMKVP